MSLILFYGLCPVIGYYSFQYLSNSYNGIISFALSSAIAYAPTYLVTNYYSTHGGYRLSWFQKLPVFKGFNGVIFKKATVELEEPLDNSKQYIFGNFPHGTCSANHVLSFTDCCEFISKHFTGDRVDLAASVLFMLPIVKELLLFLGCVDASSFTCHYNLKRKRSILIFVGGEKEQLMTEPGQHKIFLLTRKGFVKLAIQYGCDLVPMYAYGENECYDTSNVLQDFRVWLQHKFKVGIAVYFGRWGVPFGLVPKKVNVNLEVGKPIKVTQKEKDQITDADVDALHATFVSEMRRLFERTKGKYGVDKSTELQIL